MPQPLTQVAYFVLPHRESACLDQVAVEPGKQVALFYIQTPRLGPPRP